MFRDTFFVAPRTRGFEMADTDFILCDCSLMRFATGRACYNLRELLEAIRTVPEAVLEHHMMRCALDDHFELYEFPNDLARWCWDGLGDNVLGETLGLIDPYAHPSMAELRTTLVTALEDYLWGVDRLAWCRPGAELHMVASRLVVYDTGERFATAASLAEAIERISLRSLFFHVHEARRRTGGETDDFSLWLEGRDASPALVAQLRAIDFYFRNLAQLRQEILAIFRQNLAEPRLLETAASRETTR
jgi:hypothetical protein